MIWSKRLGTASLIELSRALRYALSSGMMLRDAMDLLSREGTGAIRPVAARVATDLKAGWSLQEALRKQEASFPPLFLALTAVGEESGNLPEVMGELEKYYLTQQKLRRDFFSDISWPLVQFIAAVLIIAGLILILGMLPVKAGNKDQVDPLGLGLLGYDGAITFLLGVGTGLAAIGAVYLAVSRALRKVPVLQRFLFRVPIIGPCVRSLAMTRLCIALKLMLDTRLSVLKAIQLAFTATDNSAFIAAAPGVVASIRRGNTISDSFAHTRVFPPPYRSALAVAEESGRLPEMCAVQAENYDEQARRLLGTINKIASVLIWLLVAAFIITAIFRIFSTVYLKNIEKSNDGGGQTIRTGDPKQPVLPSGVPLAP
ncbi:MAG: epsF 4 [Gemmataceae bacterium]|nr:epsF 4 [Gemmataceae bacterium]